MKELNSAEANEALSNYKLICCVEIHSDTCPPGCTLEQRIAVYAKGEEWAIKQELFDVDSYGRPTAVFLERDVSSTNLVSRVLYNIIDSEGMIYLDGRRVNSRDDLASQLNTSKTIIHKNMTNKKEHTVTGYAGAKYQYHANEEKGTSVISLTLKPYGAESEWVHVKAFNENADIIKNAWDNDDIKKFQFAGSWQDGKPYEKDGKTIEYKELIAEKVSTLKVVEVNGVIAKAEEKESATDKQYTRLFIKNNIGDQVEQHNVTVFREMKNPVPADVELKVGQPIAIRGEAATFHYRDDQNNLKQSTSITAWNVARTPTLLREQVMALENEKPVKDKAMGVKKTKKSKDAAIGM